ncbi:unnamed protein product [Colias eurytheme]|nr:unnamed protein product [Colias eurytheme]
MRCYIALLLSVLLWTITNCYPVKLVGHLLPDSLEQDYELLPVAEEKTEPKHLPIVKTRFKIPARKRLLVKPPPDVNNPSDVLLEYEFNLIRSVDGT